MYIGICRIMCVCVYVCVCTYRSKYKYTYTTPKIVLSRVFVLFDIAWFYVITSNKIWYPNKVQCIVV